jgi:uncharacterized protein (DUF1499 family)
VALLAYREQSPNGARYGGPAVAAQQKAAYPDIKPAYFDDAPATVFTRALTAARAMGWHIAEANTAAGRIEATATTTLLRFKDDVVIRIAAANGRTRVDVRSMSRLGHSDLGANAKRIRAYLEQLQITL